MTLVMSLPVVHDVNDEIEFRMLFVQCKCRRKKPRTDRNHEYVFDRMSFNYFGQKSHRLARRAKLLRFQ